MYDFLIDNANYEMESNILFNKKDGFNAIKTNFPVDGHDVYDNIEEKSFWFQHRIKCVTEIMKKFIKPKSQILDLGGGNGFNTKHLSDLGYDTILMEPSLSACKNASKRGVKNIILSILTDDNVKNNSLPNVSMFDVLECVQDDRQTLKTVYSKLKKGGHLIMVVPAFKSLWSQEDIDIGNVRRFSKNDTEKMLQELGYKIEYSNYLFEFLFAPIFFERALKDKIFKRKYDNYTEKKKLIDSQHNIGNNAIVSKGVEFCCNREYKKILKNKKIPFGSSIVIIAKK